MRFLRIISFFFWQLIHVGFVQIEVLIFSGRGGVRFIFLPRVPLFFFSRWGIRGGCRFWLRILIRISLFWVVTPCQDRANRGVCYIRGDVEGQVEIFARGPLVWGNFTRRRRIRGGCGVLMGILTRISLFWAMNPQGASANIGVCSFRR